MLKAALHRFHRYNSFLRFPAIGEPFENFDLTRLSKFVERAKFNRGSKMPYYGDTLPYYYGGAFSTHSSLMTGTGRTLHSPLGSTRYAPHLTTISESPLSALRRYTPAVTMSSRPKRIIDTADIDVSTPRALSHSRSNDQRCRLRRDRPTIRIRSQALKDNPALREHYERHEKTVGELLVEKFLIKDKKAEAEGESRTKLYSQISLENNMTKRQKEDIQRRLTRRMTRRKSSADVQIDPEQLEREVLFAQAQADALDSLVAEEQAEIEVEARMGTLIRKNLVRSAPPPPPPPPLSRSGLEASGLSGDDPDEARTKKLPKKVKKRKKTTDKPWPPGESRADSEHDAINKIIKISDENSESLVVVRKDGGGNEEGGARGERSPAKGLKFKIEASNSVGDLSTLWISANVNEAQDKQKIVSQAVVEQFRDSVRLPAPKHIANKIMKNNKKDAIVEVHQQIVVLPVKKRYVKDDARNSVYLTLKSQKNANVKSETARRNGTIDGADPTDREIDEQTPSTIINLVTANKTMGIARQPKLNNKAAKFRSKDIAESDVEVKSISELAPATPAAAIKGKIGTKDAGLLNLSGSNDDASFVITGESISKSSDRDVNGNSTSAIDQPPSPKSEITSLEIATIRDNDTPRSLRKNKTSKPIIAKIDRVPSAVQVPEKTRESEILDEADAPLKRLKKETKETPEKKFPLGENRPPKLKRSAAGSLDSFDARINLENFDDRKKEEKEDLDKTRTESNATIILSEVTPKPKKVESLPILNVETIAIPDNPIVNDDLSLLVAKSPIEFVESPVSEISEPVGVTNETGEVDSLGNSHKYENKCQSFVAQPATIESPKILAPKKISPDSDSQIKDDKNVVELPKLRKHRKILAISGRKNSEEIVEASSPESPNLEINVNGPDKVSSKPKKRVVVSSSKISSNRQLKEKATISRIGAKVDELEKSTILTNGPSDFRFLENVCSIIELNKPGRKVTEPQLETPCAKEEEEIDFWGEIKSEKIEETKMKSSERIASPNSKHVDDLLIGDQTEGTEKIGESTVIVLEAATKSNTVPESGTRDETRAALVPVEKKFNKVKKKKKTSEISGCEKKDEEKASSESILEHLKSSDEKLDEKSREKSERLEPRSEKLGENNSPNLSEEMKIVGVEVEPNIERFERNLSTIIEESQSPTREDTPKIEALDLVEESSTPKQKSPFSCSLLNEASGESNEKTLSKDFGASLSTSTEEKPEVPETSEDPVKPEVVPMVEPGKEGSIVVSPSDPEFSVPAISIALIKSSEEEGREGEPEAEALGDEDGPGTPTNETVEQDCRNNISKWQGLDDLSLDQPDKDIGPEVALANLLKRSKKKKVASTKKASKKNSGDKNSTKSTSAGQDSSKKKKLGKKKKSSSRSAKDEERSGSKVSNSSDTTLKPGGLNLCYTPKNSGRNSPKQRPLDLIKIFYTTPASLLTATPRDLSKVRRAKVKKRKHSSRTASASSDSTGSTRSTHSTATTESTGSTDREEEDPAQKRISSTRSNDSGFDGSPRLSNCDMACHKKCEKLTGNLCGLNQKLVAEALQALKRAPSQSSDTQRNSDGSDHHASGRITPPATNLPRFKKYTVMDFNFLKVLGKGSFGKVLLAELRRTDCVYAVKCLKKDVVLEDDDVECTLIERKVLTLATRHPYLCHLFCTFQTDSHLFFVMEYLNGGDLMFHIQKSGRFAESRARFYAAEIWSGLNFLHKKGIVYRDLKLDNVLLDFEGHIRIADFGMCKLQIFLDRTADTFCGTPDYMAPEIIKGLKYNQAVDWWSFGVLLYEMLTGQSPFSGCDEDELFWSICNERPFIPRYLSQEAMDVLICLLEKDAGKRPPAHEISIHPFFHSLAWDRLERRQLEPPFKPALEHTLDTRYFDTAFTAERPRLTPVPEQILTSMDQGVFRGFSYTNPNATD
ncbi:uncharacterized protein [Venturia canescens]|uniref:uncharacterized protein isoform X2 n=1 Tax=Venturia canescens TaxID=32260 RepID=UPI001C9D1861|nr:uncharacterized protein LOC122417454 isoform X2 [Venturia canescens]